jgi:hypothetical protein
MQYESRLSEPLGISLPLNSVFCTAKVGLSDFYSGGTRFEYRPGHRLFGWSSSWVSRAPQADAKVVPAITPNPTTLRYVT